ncbi:GNAT family N-acetyltransferase [Pseudonocardia ailaonensis]|uniref:GNAT family N-acetyltransferase n=1 Tax=Pseudonocardia ailaonensis TaxID=367279 RepID=A0ABN2MX76_9PSEU
MEVRTARAGDAGAIARVQVESWRAAYRGLIADDVLDGLSVEDRTAVWAGALAAPAAHLDVTEVGGEVVGFVAVSPGMLHALYTLPSVWGTGVGLALHDGGVERIRAGGAEGAELSVLEGNARAVRFYLREGWVLGEAGTETVMGGLVLPVRRMHLALSPR